MTFDAGQWEQNMAETNASSWPEEVRPSTKGKSLDDLDIRYSLQPATMDTRLPYPIHLDPELFVVGWRGPADEGDKLIGFQRGNTQRLVLHIKDFIEDPTKAKGLAPVFSNGDGFYSLDLVIASVSTFNVKDN